MDARCVMEQRLQSMVCCVSMVQRALDHQQPQPQSSQSSQQQSQQGSHTDSNPSPCPSPCPCPAHTVPVAEAAAKVRVTENYRELHTCLGHAMPCTPPRAVTPLLISNTSTPPTHPFDSHPPNI